MFEKKARQSLVVYLNYYRDAKKIANLGDMVYKSRRGRYVVLYVDKERTAGLIEDLSKERFVKKVVPSYIQELDQNLVGSLWRTGSEGEKPQISDTLP